MADRVMELDPRVLNSFDAKLAITGGPKPFRGLIRYEPPAR